MGRLLDGLSDWTDEGVQLLAVPIGICTSGLVFSEVLMRYVVQAPLIAWVELARLGFVWCCFLGAALGVKREKHIRFVFLLERLPWATAAALRVLAAAVACGFFLLLVVSGVQMVERVRGSYFPALGFSQAWLYLPVPLSGGAMLVHAAAILARALGEWRRGVGGRP